MDARPNRTVADVDRYHRNYLIEVEGVVLWRRQRRISGAQRFSSKRLGLKTAMQASERG